VLGPSRQAAGSVCVSSTRDRSGGDACVCALRSAPLRRRGCVCHHGPMQEMRRFFRANPQVLVLLLVCVILGLGTFIAVVIGLIGAHGGQVSGEPAGVIALAHVL
jgi:hypothetical protein